MASDKNQPPQSPKSPLPSEDPNLRLSISSNHPIGDIYVSGSSDDVVEKATSAPAPTYTRRGVSPLIIVTCLGVLIGLLVALYFLVQYLIR